MPATHDVNTRPFRILVPLDGSEEAEIALEFAQLLPANRIVLLHVESDQQFLIPDLESSRHHARIEQMRASLERLAAPLRTGERTIAVSVRFGDIAEEIIEAALDCDLIAMMTHGRGAAGRTIFGSVADRVSRHSKTPTILIRASLHPKMFLPKRVVTPLDGSPIAELALPLAKKLATELSVPLHLLHVLDRDDILETIQEQRLTGADPVPPAATDDFYEWSGAEASLDAATYLSNQATSLRTEGIEVETELLQGTPTFALLSKIMGDDLVVLASHGRSGPARWLLGSVAEKLVREAEVPILIVPARAAASSGATDDSAATDARLADAEKIAALHGSKMTRDEIMRLLQKDHYTVKEAASLLGMDANMLNQAVHRRELPATLVGRNIISITQADLLQWLKER